MLSPTRDAPKSLRILSPKIFKKKTNKYFIKGNQKIYLSHLDIQTQNCILSLLKESSSRNSQDLSTIQTFLETSDLACKLKADKLLPESLNKTLTMCSNEMKHLYLTANTTLFRIGDKGDNFYIIINGRISILKPIPKKIIMTSFEYFRLIVGLQLSKETYILNQTIEHNKHIIQINTYDIQNLHLIVFKRMIKEYFGKYNFKSRTVTDIMKACYISKDFFDFEIDNDLIAKDVVYRSKIEKQIMKALPKFDIEIMDKYQVLLNENLKIEFIIYEYQSFLELGQGAFFGDSALDKQTTRNATIKTIEDTHFCFLHCQYYNSYLKQEKQRITLKEINFLLNNFFFDKIPFKIFEKIFANFILEEKKKNDVIIREDSDVKYIYFIKEGIIELTMNKSLQELYDLSSKLIKTKTKEELNLNELTPLPEGHLTISQKILNRKIFNKLLLLNSKEIIGIDCIEFDIDYIYTAKVISETAKIYKIELRLLNKLLKHQNQIYKKYIKSSLHKMEILLNRMIDIFNNKINKCQHNKCISLDISNKVIKKVHLIKRKHPIHINHHKRINNIKTSDNFTVYDYYPKTLSSPITQRTSSKMLIRNSTTTTSPSISQFKETKEYLMMLRYNLTSHSKSPPKNKVLRTSAFCIEQENYMFNKIQRELETDKLFINKVIYKKKIAPKINNSQTHYGLLGKNNNKRKIRSLFLDRNNKLFETNTDRTNSTESKILMGLNNTCFNNGNNTNDLYLNSTICTTNHARNLRIYYRDTINNTNEYKTVNYKQNMMKRMLNIE